MAMSLAGSMLSSLVLSTIVVVSQGSRAYSFSDRSATMDSAGGAAVLAPTGANATERGEKTMLVSVIFNIEYEAVNELKAKGLYMDLVKKKLTQFSSQSDVVIEGLRGYFTNTVDAHFAYSKAEAGRSDSEHMGQEAGKFQVTFPLPQFTKYATEAEVAQFFVEAKDEIDIANPKAVYSAKFPKRVTVFRIKYEIQGEEDEPKYIRSWFHCRMPLSKKVESGLQEEVARAFESKAEEVIGGQTRIKASEVVDSLSGKSSELRYHIYERLDMLDQPNDMILSNSYSISNGVGVTSGATCK